MASMSERRRAVAALAAERAQKGAGRRLATRALVALVLLLLLIGPALWAMGFLSPPPAVAEVQNLVDEQVATYQRVARGELPFAEAPSFGSMMEKMRDLAPEYRDQIGRQMGRLRQARERAELASYFALPPAQRQAELDRRIKADEARRAAWQAEREKRDQQRAAAGQQAGAAGGERGGRGTGGGGPAGVGAGGPARGPGGRPGGRSEEARNDRIKQRLDRTSPEERAQQAEYRRALDVRRAQLGLPTGGRRGG